MKSTPFILAFFLCLNLLHAQVPGMPDLSFGNGLGYVTPTVDPEGVVSTALVVQPDGKIVTAAGGNYIWILRFNPDGSPDSGFGQNGSVKLNVPIVYDEPNLALTSDGKILVAGETGSNPNQVAIVRLKSNGDRDSTFGTAGVKSFNVVPNASFTSQTTMTIEPVSGSIFLAGGYDLYSFPYTEGFAVVALNVDGSFNGNFGNGGILTVSVNFPSDFTLNFSAMKLGPDGKILLAGEFLSPVELYANTQIFVERLNADGSPDLSFGQSGHILVGPDNLDLGVLDLDIQSNGRIIVLTEMYTNDASNDDLNLGYKIFGFTPGGALDPGFGQNGEVTLEHSNQTESYTVYGRMSIQSDDKIVVAGGKIITLFGVDLRLTRLGTNGSLDAVFGSSGTQLFHLNGKAVYATDVAIQPDGKIVTCGTIVNLSTVSVNLVVNRFNPGPLVGVEEPPSGVMHLKVGPNPVGKNLLQVDYDLAAPTLVRLSLWNSTGQIACPPPFAPQWQSAGAHQCVVNLPPALVPGIYWLILEAGEDREIKALVVER